MKKIELHIFDEDGNLIRMVNFEPFMRHFEQVLYLLDSLHDARNVFDVEEMKVTIDHILYIVDNVKRYITRYSYNSDIGRPDETCSHTLFRRYFFQKELAMSDDKNNEARIARNLTNKKCNLKNMFKIE